MIKLKDLIIEQEINQLIEEGFIDKVKSILSKASGASEKVLIPFFKLYQVIMKKIPSTKANIINTQLNSYAETINSVLENAMGEESIEKVIKKSMGEAKKLGLIPEPAESKEAIKNKFKQNMTSINAIIKKNIRQETRVAKQKIQNVLTSVDTTTPKPSTSKLKSFTVGAAGPMVFGFIDNAGMFVGMGAVEESLMEMGFDSMIAAGVGNTFSDALGAASGGAVAIALWKYFKIKGKSSITQQFLGVMVGCLIPIAIKLALQSVGIFEVKLLDKTRKLFQPKKAEKVAKDLKKSDPDWTYKVIHDPKKTGYSFIKIYDEDNEFVGYF